MNDPYFQEMFAERIGGNQYGKSTELYKFEKIKRAKRDAIASYPDRKLLDFGVGENDGVADKTILDSMAEQMGRPENRGYADNGISEYSEAAAAFMKREFDVILDPETEINHSVGTKIAYALIPAILINPGDITIMTTPGYPVAGTHTKWYGGEVYNAQLLEENAFLPDLKAIPDAVLERTKLMVINYPNSPTGGLATKAFYEEVVRFAHEHNVVIVQDAAHAMFSFGAEALSFLQIDGAKEVGIEVHSMSKGFDMIGWRLGFIAGNRLLVQAFGDVKDNSDSGQFKAIQHAGAAGLNDPSIPARLHAKYKRRMKKLVATLQEVGFDAKMPGGTYFLYTKSPTGVAGRESFENAEAATNYLITQHSICTVPWDDVSPYLRFSTTYEAATEAEEDELMEDLKGRLSSVELNF